MSLRKYQAAILIITISSSVFFPSALFAKGNTSASQTSVLSKETRQKLLQGKQQLKSLGNPKEYASMEVQWDNEKQKPGKIRKLHKKASKDIVGDTKKVIGDISSLYSIAPTYVPDLRLEKDTVSKTTKERHVRLQQFRNNLEIIGGELISHVDKDGFVYQIDGAIDTPNISTIPKVSATKALSIGKQEHGTKAKFKVTKKPELVLYKFASAYILAYRYTISYDDPVAHMGQWIYYIDANTGKKINSYSLTDSIDTPTVLSGTILGGEGGAIKTFTGTFDTIGNKYYTSDMFSLNKSYLIYNASSNTGIYTDASNIANRFTSDWGNSDTTEISAAYNMSKTLEYYNTLGFGTNNIIFTWTGQTELPVIVHYGSGYNNAAWNPGDGLYIGDGDGVNFKPLAVLDIVAHEFGHAWTDNTSNLVYQDEQGAITESFSDISGVNVEFYTQQSATDIYPNTGSGQADWLIGEDAVIGRTALRDMRNPANSATVGTGNEQPTKYKGNYWYFGFGDNGGVHYNSSIQNFFYYLLAEGGSGNNEGILYSVDGIGITEASRIAFETNTHFVTSTTDYKGVRQAWIDAANSLHPTDSSFAASVKVAWDAVGVVSDPIVSLATSTESFEDDTNLPVGYTSSLLVGTGNIWSVTTTTGAMGSNSLISGTIEDDLTWTGNWDNYQSKFSTTSLSLSGVNDDGYMTFYWRTSSESIFDTLDFYIDGVKKKSWSGINPWSFYNEAITSGSHIFKWEYSKDSFMTGGLDQVGIDAVHMVSMIGTLDVSSDTGSGQYVSSSGFQGIFNTPTSYDYVASRSDGQMSKGSASGTVSFPLVGMPEGFGSIDFQYRDSNGFLSQIFTQNFFFDSIAPTTAEILTPANFGLYSTGNITLYWNPVTDTGAGLSVVPYTYLVSTNSGFISTVASGSISFTETTLSLADGVYFAKIETRDLAGNISTSPEISFTIDTIVPVAPTNIFVNNGIVIDANTQAGVTISGSGGLSESGSIISYNIFSSSGSVSETGLIDISGSFYFSGIDVSSLDDGMLNYSLGMIDIVGNTGTIANGTIGKSVIPAAGNILFLSGTYSNTITTNIEISAAKPVSYTLFGSGIVSIITGSLASSGSVTIPVDLSATDGNKTLQIDFTDSAEVVTTTFASIILDTTPPTLSINSHSSGAQVIGSTLLLTGSVFDMNGLASTTLNSISLSSSSNWSRIMNLSGGSNVFTLVAIDSAGNSNSLPITIEREIALSNIITSLLPIGIQIDFETDLVATGVINYGTDSGSFSDSQEAISSDGLYHNLTLTGLSSNTLYYYTIQGVMTPYSSAILSGSFRSSTILDISTISNSVVSTGAVIFSGVSSTGDTVFQSTGTLSIANENIPEDTIILSLSGLTITTSGTGIWDGMIESPKTTVLTGASISESGYTLTGSIYKAGNNTTSLTLSGILATMQIYVGTNSNGDTLRVYRSDTGGLFDPIDSCIVSLGICQFQTNHFSYFAFATPSDSTPDTFTFTAQTGVERSVNTDSNIATLSGTNTSSVISISGGSYSINSLAYTTATGIIYNGDTVKVRVMSSSSYNTISQAVVTIGSVSASFSVTTKSAPVVSSGGGGGGGSYTTSPVTTTTTGTTSIIPNKPITPPVVLKSGLFASNSIVSAYDFTINKRIPQKVAAELNFFVTKLVKNIDKNAGNNEKKRNQYKQIVKRYIINRVKQSSDEREKRIMQYLYKRSSVVMKMVTQ
ncbi:MAG: M4 family metallopeptidase [Candidatus Gracilibacteria bacterium]|nr:M4 family metallopeptidase [Candidatus Gracilibacteria bacterium]